MDRNIIFLVNPVAGTAKKEGLLKQIANITTQKGYPHSFVTANRAGDYGFLKTMIEQENITDIIIVGGDGTINHVVSALQGVKVRFGIIPLGSGNGLAYSACISRKPLKALEQMLIGMAKPVDGFFINGHFSCMLSGLGLDASVAHDFDTGAARGLATYIYLTVKNFLAAKPFRFLVTVNNFSFVTNAFFISLANSNQFGNNVTIAPGASLCDGLIDVVIAPKMNKLKLLFTVLRQLRGNNKPQQLSGNIPPETVLYFQTDELCIKNPHAALLHIDGDPVETDSAFTIKVQKHCFELIHP